MPDISKENAMGLSPDDLDEAVYGEEEANEQETRAQFEIEADGTVEVGPRNNWFISMTLSEEQAREKGLLPPRTEEKPTAEAGVGGPAASYPYIDGDTVVLGPGVFVDGAGEVISWEGENYYKAGEVPEPRREITDKDRELIAANAKATIERRDAERRENALKIEAMGWAVQAHTASFNAGYVPTRGLCEVADDILGWLLKKS
jgi:hypothetical protein